MGPRRPKRTTWVGMLELSWPRPQRFSAHASRYLCFSVSLERQREEALGHRPSPRSRCSVSLPAPCCPAAAGGSSCPQMIAEPRAGNFRVCRQRKALAVVRLPLTRQQKQIAASSARQCCCRLPPRSGCSLTPRQCPTFAGSRPAHIAAPPRAASSWTWANSARPVRGQVGYLWSEGCRAGGALRLTRESRTGATSKFSRLPG